MNENTSVNQPEFEKIDALNREAWAIRVSDSNRAFEWSKEAIRLSEAVQYEKGKAEGLRTFGFCHIRLAKYQEAFALLEQAYSTFVRLGDIRNEAIIHEYFGIIHRSTGNYATSLEELYKALSLISEKHFLEEETLVLYHLSITYKYLGDLDKALEYALKGLPMARAIGAEVSESYHLNGIGGVYFEMGRYEEARDYFQQSLLLRQTTGDQWGVAGCYDNLGNICFRQGNDREALRYYLQSLEITGQTGDLKGRGNTLFDTARVYARMHDYDNALDYCHQSLQIREQIGDKKGQAGIFCFLGSLCSADDYPGADLQQSLDYLGRALSLARDLNARDIMYDIHYHLYKTCKRLGEPAKALDHFETSVMLEKEMNNEAAQQRILHLQITHQVAQSQKEAEIYRLKNVELAKLVETVNSQKEQLQKTLDHLKSTQTQLIQSEKLASLGELTAGIAHEIQNPLNFVNNFSELSVDLAKDLKEEISKPDVDKGYIDELLTDLTQNQQKINHHGKRAAAIVSGMLYHARASTGKKEPTDLNALADEYLRLVWHGLRAKDPNFNAGMVTDFDPTVGKVEVIPQDMGRVLLNLINNAFYAVQQRQREEGAAQDLPGFKNQEGLYSPAVTVSTQKIDNQVIIKVKDNGTGIPDDLKTKIFQPFFTTKPTGQGTGLGLSLAFDIVTKGHGGKMLVESSEGEGTVFVVQMPV